MKKNYGLVIKKRDPRNLILGGLRSLPKVVVQPDGQHDAYKPAREIQRNQYFDSYNCTGYGWDGAIEFDLNRQKLEVGDKSDRRTGIKAKTKPPGNDPRIVGQAIHESGVVAETSLPFNESIKTIEEYYSYKGGEEWKCDLEGQDFLKKFEFRYEELWSRRPSKEDRIKIIKECLQYSVIPASFSAWTLKDGVYVDDGKPNNHWAIIYGWTDMGWKVFDSYDNSEKIVSFDHKIDIAMRFMLIKQATSEEISIFMKILQTISNWLNLWQKEQNATITSPTINSAPSPVQPPTEPVGSKLIEWAAAIRDYEGGPGDLSYRSNNPGNIRNPNGTFKKFQTWADGWNYLLDYLTRAATGRHKSYKPDFTLLQFFKVYAPSADKNNPTAYANYVAKRINVPITTQIKDLV